MYRCSDGGSPGKAYAKLRHSNQAGCQMKVSDFVFGIGGAGSKWGKCAVVRSCGQNLG